MSGSSSVSPPPPPPHLFVCQQYYLGRWNLSRLLIHLPPVLWELCWLLRCSWRTLLLSPWTLRPRRAVLVFSCICRWVRERRARSSAKVEVIKMGPRCPLNFIHIWAMGVFNTQFIASRNRKGDSRHPCLTLVFTWKASVSWRSRSLCMSFHCRSF